MFRFPSRSLSDSCSEKINRSFYVVLLASLLLGLVVLGGCGQNETSDTNEQDQVELATVGEFKITVGDYKTMLMKMEPADLPRDDAGYTMDMATTEGKDAFIKVMVNKDLMYSKALALGYQQDEKITGTRRAMSAFEGTAQMFTEEVSEPSLAISEEELAAYFERYGESRAVRYVLVNSVERAEEAREFAKITEDWDEVVARFDESPESPNNPYSLKIPWGQYAPAFQDPVFAVEEGEVCEVIPTAQGFWVLRVDQVKYGRKPALEEVKGEVLKRMGQRNMAQARQNFMKSVMESHKYEMNMETLEICYSALPENEPMMDPETGKPMAREKLRPLNIQPADMNRIFYSYTLSGELIEVTLGDYKDVFDKLNVFKRPRDSEMVGTVLNKVRQLASDVIMADEAKIRGYVDGETVQKKIDKKLEEMMVSNLFNDVVSFNEYVSPEDLDQFWAEKAQEYHVPEARSGLAVMCADSLMALRASEAAKSGTSWEDILEQFGTDPKNKENKGQTSLFYSTVSDPYGDTFFALEDGAVSEPFNVFGGVFAVVKLTKIEPAFDRKLEDVREMVAARIRGQRENAAFEELLADWKVEFPVVIHDDVVETLPSWQELRGQTVPAHIAATNRIK